MKNRILVPVVAVMLVSLVGLTGCKNPPWKSKTGTATGTEAPVPPLGQGDVNVGDRPPEGVGMVRGQFTPVYFDYDSAKIRAAELSKMEAVAAFMKANSGKHLVIEGHCDERGTAEYNRALGERRALAAREELARMGVAVNRMSTVSYGKDRPVDPTHDDTAWSRNRRCEFATTN